jgi:hypothetical protein
LILSSACQQYPPDQAADAAQEHSYTARWDTAQALPARAENATVRTALLAAREDADGNVPHAEVQAPEDWIIWQKFPRSAATSHTA